MKPLDLLARLIVLGVGFALSCGQLAGAADATKPNIVVILADDFGWGSAGCYGATGLKTPSLDRLAREGRRFTNAYAPGSVCSPTRYGLLTGRYYWRTSKKDGRVLPVGSPLHIETTRTTLASLSKSQGYATAAVGKWHLGFGLGAQMTDWSAPLKPGPLEIGFDYYFGLAGNLGNGPHYYIENHEVLGKIPGQPVVVSGRGEIRTTSGLKELWKETSVMETLTGNVTDWIQQNRQKPFFVYFAPQAVHEPVVPNARFTGSPYGRYGDFIHELDWSVGQVLATLDRHKLTDNTLLIFTSDNGGWLSPPDSAVAIEAGLAINGSLRGGKVSEWEGGFREPFLVRWPGHVPAGTVSDQVICLTDMLATLANVLRVPLTEGNAEDSFDVLRAFTEAEPGAPVRDHVILQAGGGNGTHAIRMGNWKLIERANSPDLSVARNLEKAAQAAKKAGKSASRQDELFNLAEDPSETTDVRAANADRAAQLLAALVAARERSFTRPGAGK